MVLSREWFSLAELAALRLPGLPEGERGLRARAKAQRWDEPARYGQIWRRREASGGGFEFHYSVLPPEARAEWLHLFLVVEVAAESQAARDAAGSNAELWAWFLKQAGTKQDEARRRLLALEELHHQDAAGRERRLEVPEICRRHGISARTLYNWEQLIRGVPRHDWLPHLAPRHAGRQEQADCSPEAWEFIKSYWLRLTQPTFRKAFRELQDAAALNGWTIPSASTLRRRLDALPPEVIERARKGKEALARMLPSQRRDRSSLHAMEALNADGHTVDLFVRWRDGQIIRPVLVAFQDLYSNKILSGRWDKTENSGSVRLAFGDAVEKYGLPKVCTFDNGRHFASKKLTGGQDNRFRFIVRAEDPDGMLTTLGVKVRFTTPYHGQAKPIERFFRDVAGDFVRHPVFAGAWTGGNPAAKPEDYGTKAIPYDLFMAHWQSWLAAYNARPARETQVCGGRLSFDEAFDASWQAANERCEIQRPHPHQRHLWLLAAEAITVRGDSSVHLYGNRYHGDCLKALRGSRVVLRYDPENLHQPVQVYRGDGAFLGEAACIENVGFYSEGDAKTAHRERKGIERRTRQNLEAMRRMSLDELSRLRPEEAAEAPAKTPNVVRIISGNTALKARPAQHQDLLEDADRMQREAMEKLRAARNGPQLRIVPDEN